MKSKIQRLAFSLVLILSFGLACCADNVTAPGPGGAAWVQTSGPGGGSVNALIAKGTILFAGTAAGDVYRSTDNGASWTAVNTGLTNLSVHALGVSGTSLFAGTGGGGAFRSTDNAEPVNDCETPAS